MSYQARLKKEFNDRIVGALKEEFGYANTMQVPKLQKLVRMSKMLRKLLKICTRE